MKNRLILLLFFSTFTTYAYAMPSGIKYIEKPWKAPEIGLSDSAGYKHTLADYRGKLLIVNFWGIWCQPCRKEMPSLQRAYHQLIKEDITIIAIAMGDSLADIIHYKKNNPVDFALLSDSNNNVSTNWLVSALPTTYIINQKGEVIIRVVGEYKWDNASFLEEIKALKNNINP